MGLPPAPLLFGDTLKIFPQNCQGFFPGTLLDEEKLGLGKSCREILDFRTTVCCLLYF